MTSTPRRTITLVVIAVVVVAGVAIALVASNRSTSTSSSMHSGTVDVLYAGSFSDLMSQQIDPAFHTATGFTVTGVSNGSTALATEIKGGIEVGDVFISASPKADDALAGSANGNWVSSYREFGTSPLVLGYTSASSFASALASQPWYSVVDRAGFRLGRTDPATDPKGVLAVQALDETAAARHLPALATLATSDSNVFPETTLVGEVQAGQLDAGFFYSVEASAAKQKTVSLTGTTVAGTYTIAQLRGAPHSTAAEAFIAYLLSPAGERILSKNGVTPVVPAVQHRER